MANIINNNFNNLKIKLNTDEYWDFFVCKDVISDSGISNVDGNGCLVSYIDMSDEECIENNWIKGKENYVWNNANTTDYTLYNIGYTGFDNGLFSFRKDRISNKEFLDLYQNTTFKNEDKTSVLHLHAVSGCTLQYDYPVTVEDDSIKLNGGFYQGYFETECDKYKILPSTIDNEWNFEFILKKSNLEPESTKTLNDKYPNNKGIFFYIGTRAENKWIYLYDDTENECDSLGIGDYVEGGDIDIKTFETSKFTDIKWDITEELNIDEYISYKYYDEKPYYPKKINKDELFIDDYMEINTKKEIEKTKCYHDLEDCGCEKPKHKPCFCSPCLCWKPKKHVYYHHNYFQDDLYFFKRRFEFENICHHHETPKPKEDSRHSRWQFFGDNYLTDIKGLDECDDLQVGEYVEDELDISDFDFKTYNGFSLKTSKQYKFETDNKFLFFNRTCTGFTVDNWIEGTKVEFQGHKSLFKGNLFLLMNRTCTGYTVENIDELRESAPTDYNIYKDLYNNALAFRITDEGAIGYKYYALDCEEETKCKCIEGYSKEGIIKDDEWYTINVKIENLNNSFMKLYFYVNGKLKFITNDLPMLDLRQLNDLYEKQEGVPYNISLGGGTQGLAETVLPNYMRNPYRTYPLEENFAGSFIGYIKSFKFYQCDLNYRQILYNFSKSKERLTKIR